MKHQQLAPSDDPLVHWRARHDNVIMLHLSGYSNELIAEMTQFSIGHVQRFIKDPRAQKAIETARRKLLGKAIYTIRERMVNLGVRAVENIAGTIEGIDGDGSIVILDTIVNGSVEQRKSGVIQDRERSFIIHA